MDDLMTLLTFHKVSTKTDGQWKVVGVFRSQLNADMYAREVRDIRYPDPRLASTSVLVPRDCIADKWLAHP